MTPWIRWNADAAHAEPAWRWLAEDLGMPALLATPARPRADMQLPVSRLPEPARQKLVALMGPERVRQEDDERILHAAGRGVAQLRLRGGDLSHAPDAVLYPRQEDDVLALLRICADANIAVACHAAPRGEHAAIVTCNMTGMANILSLDAMSGLVCVESGIASAELGRQLGARGLAFGPASFSTLGGWITRGTGTQGVEEVRMATPQGILSSIPIMAGSSGALGIVTAATLRIRAAPARSLRLNTLFPDFASGLAAMREAQRESIVRIDMRLSDAAETRFHRRLAGMNPTLWQRIEDLYRGMRRFDDGAAALEIVFSGSAADVDIARKRFSALAKKLGAVTRDAVMPPDYTLLLLDRGVTLDSICASASWSNLPVLYAALRTALDQAMRAHAPRDGAHGLVLARIADARHDGADLTCTFVFPRLLNDDVAQAQAIRQAALDVLAAHARTSSALETDILCAIRAVVDPKNILNPGTA
jgi:alkyldihydroxyacetonephosphate synthase